MSDRVIAWMVQVFIVLNAGFIGANVALEKWVGVAYHTLVMTALLVAQRLDRKAPR